MRDGIINIYKEKGYTSFDVIAKLRGILKIRKIGHTGTLDPDAEGVLPVCIGKATKVCGLLTDKDKEYVAVLRLGLVTETQDVSGAVLKETAVDADEGQVRKAVRRFVGNYMQTPPMYSALKVDGKKLCDLAREGITVERSPRPVTIYQIEILEMELPRVTLRVLCSKGTYIRTLCHDIGEVLGCGGCMESLVRTRVVSFSAEGECFGEFSAEKALKLSQVEEMVRQGIWEEAVVPVEELFSLYEKAVVAEPFGKLLYNGNRLQREHFKDYRASWEDDCVRVYDAADNFIGIYGYQSDHNNYKPVKLFL